MEYVINILIVICIYAILGLSLNLVVGYSGLLSIAHAGFYGIGAYATAIGMTRYGLTFFETTLLGMGVAAVVGACIGLVLSRFRHDFYVICSLGFTMIVFSVLLNLESVTNGALGIPGVGRPAVGPIDFGSNVNFLLLLLALVVAVAALLRTVVRSPFGRVVQALREDEEMTQVFGFHTFWFKLMAFVLAASLAAMAGSCFASYISFIDPFSFGLNESIFMVVIIAVGGLASIPGSILGAMLLIFLPEGLRFVGMPPEVAAQVRQMLYGLALILLMMFRPQGMLGKFRM